MDLRILGCSGSCYPGEHAPAFLLDRRLLMDAGTVCSTLDSEQQQQIEAVLITHPHLDHVKGLANLADNLVLGCPGKNLTVHAIEPVIRILKDHLFNGLIWPDFSTIPNDSSPVIRWRPLPPCQTLNICGYEVTAVPVTHSVPAAGFLVSSESTRILFTGDTGPCDLIWKYAPGLPMVITEVSFPNSLNDLALSSGHLTPHLLKSQLDKLTILPDRILVMHLKTMHRQRIVTELAELGYPQIEIMQDGAAYRL